MDGTFYFDAPDADGATTQRGTPRDSMLLQAMVRPAAGGEAWPARVRNLSAGGMMAECAAPFTRGEAVIVDIRSVENVDARIAWVASGRIGVSFDRAIDPVEARRAKPVAQGTTMLLIKPVAATKRPPLKTK